MSLPVEFLPRISDELPTLHVSPNTEGPPDFHGNRLPTIISDFSSLLSFRLVNRAFAPIGLRTLLEHQNAIFIDASEASLDRFENICACENLAKEIKHVAYFSPIHIVSPESKRSRLIYNWGHSLEALDDLVAEYEKVFVEQDDILYDNDIETVLLKAIDCFLKLEKLEYVAGRSGKSLSRPAFNRDRRWRKAEARSDDEEEEDERVAKHNSWYSRVVPNSYEEGGRRLRRGCPSPLITAIEKHTDRHPSKPLALHFEECIFETLDNSSWIDFLNWQHNIVQYAMSHVETFSFRLPPEGPQHGWSNDDLVKQVQRTWLPLLQVVGSLQELDMRGLDRRQHHALTSTIVKNFTFRHLRRLLISSSMTKCTGYQGYRSRYIDENSDAGHTTSELSDFLYRHRNTLQDLTLQEATGIDPSDSRTSNTALRALLTHLRDNYSAKRKCEVWE